MRDPPPPAPHHAFANVCLQPGTQSPARVLLLLPAPVFAPPDEGCTQPQPQAALHRTAETPSPPQAWKEKERSSGPHPAREAEGLQHPQTQTPAGRHTQTWLQRVRHTGLHNRGQTVLPGPGGARSSHARTSTRTHRARARHSIGRAGMRRPVRARGPAHRHADMRHRPRPRWPPTFPRRHTSAGRVSALITGPSRLHTRTAPPPEHLPPSWRLQRSRARRRGRGRGRGLGVGSGAGSGWGPLQRPRRPRPSAVSPTAQGLRRPPPPRSHMPAPAGGTGAGQSGAPPP